ncbi:TetR/AcrR family transcriptional regulator [Bradyrhizobium genosp. P]|uniref:TetR/AcrR family transcriptional regulator n=1 Tax=Bradyrhizobium genosp. P TaxID=83641 RepID=UPI003CF20178
MQGYEATTLDEIAAVSGISRRTFFHYFRSKDDILVAHLEGYEAFLKATVLQGSITDTPLDVAREALLKASNSFNRADRLQSRRWFVKMSHCVCVDKVIFSSMSRRCMKHRANCGRPRTAASASGSLRWLPSMPSSRCRGVACQRLTDLSS